VQVKFLDGTADGNGIWDAVVEGDVTFANGAGTAETDFDRLSVERPVVIKSDLTVLGTGSNMVTVGTQQLKTGLKVGGNLTIQADDVTDIVDLHRLRVAGIITVGAII
jgi:hypothetical protein